jgi:hypothetical protein
MTRLLGLLVLLFAILIVQAVSLTEAFGSSQGGAQIQLAASNPVVFLAEKKPTLVTTMTPAPYLNLQGPQPLFQLPPF